MSSSAAYGWTYQDREAERQRLLRVRLAEQAQRAENLRRARLRAQLDELSERASELRGEAGHLRRTHRVVRVEVGTVAVADGASSAELAEAVRLAERQNARAEGELARAVDRAWTALVAEAATAPARPAAPRRRGETPAERAVAARAAAEEHLADVRERAVAGAEALLAREVVRCDPADLPELALLRSALDTAPSAQSVRAAQTDLADGVQRSVERRRLADQRDELRSGLIQLAQDAEPAERDRLTAELAAAAAPETLRPRVARAVAAADAARNRARVAEALAAALRERDYLVGEDFADLLAEDGAAVVPFDAPGGGGPAEGYGLRVVLSRETSAVSTAVVRGPHADAGTNADAGTDAGADGRRDEEVQRWFCDAQLPAIESSARAHGVDLERRHAMLPGLMAAPLLPESAWPRTAPVSADQSSEQSSEQPAEQRPKPAKRRSGNGSGTGSGTVTPYQQERYRER
ncbi:MULTISPECIES: hypothetical protein [Kitasatospora]|uniref:Uncharacterized protein n=1 Tax=Kitasatospora setae (strain ATCC 33774 / DSM 43861 / JCM 3304 / KCC A-0304 / NBRC 14216 / KM-6054) TaxID=452652 RepID=E4N7A0_KITSK|nr:MULTISPECIES: hypothetical protein [Kitasatospora]BAJ27081.1 hypothetical protein KSE_12480 [Kitasatospora setae KM-6054]